MTKRELINRLSECLTQNGFESAEFEATQIVDFAAANSCPGISVTAECEKAADAMLIRRLNNEPLQYILGEWEFYGLPIKVGEGVLIPRPDTETVVDTALKLIKPFKNATVLDLCAGSGCIGIALAHYSKAKVIFFEKSPQALSYLRQNTVLNSIDGEIKEYDVLCEPPDTVTADMIVSNPPYIKTEVINGLSAEVKKEPKMALDGGNDGLTFYRHIAKKWKTALKNGGWLVFEIGFDQEQPVIEILKAEGFTSVECNKDLAGNPRVVFGRYKI